jgi:hypothetical protein
MKMKNIRQIAICLLIGAALHDSSSAHSATGSYRLEHAVPGMQRKKAMPCVRRPITATPREGGSQPAASHRFNAGENSFSVGDNWFRD